MDIWKYLGELPDKTKYITNLIDKDRLDRLDSTFIKKRREELKEEIKKLDDLEKNKKILDKKNIHDFLKKRVKHFKEVSPRSSKEDRIRFIDKTMMPELRKYGFNETPEYVEKLLLDWPEES